MSMNTHKPPQTKRYVFQWTENSPTFGTGYRVIDTLTNLDITHISALPGRDRYAKKDQATAYRIAEARVNKLNEEDAS